MADIILNRLTTADVLPIAKWEQKSTHLRPSTNNISNNFRGCYVFEKMGESFSDFVAKQRLITNAINPMIDALNPLFYIRR